LRTEAEILKKYEELNERMAKITPGDSFSIASTDGQRFILEWVLNRN